jgi:hypothetical protein
MKKLAILFLLLAGCAHLPVSPAELRPGPERNPEIATQEAILPNTSFAQMLQRMQVYSEQCLNGWHDVDCGRNCKTLVKFTGTIVRRKTTLTLFLQKKGGYTQSEAPRDGVYLMMAEALTNGRTQQLTVHGFDSLIHGYTTQSTIDWLADRKKVCPKL